MPDRIVVGPEIAVSGWLSGENAASSISNGIRGDTFITTLVIRAWSVASVTRIAVQTLAASATSCGSVAGSPSHCVGPQPSMLSVAARGARTNSSKMCSAAGRWTRIAAFWHVT